MSRFSTGRLLSRGLFQSLPKLHAATPTVSPWSRLLLTSARQNSAPTNNSPDKSSAMESLARGFMKSSAEGAGQADIGADLTSALRAEEEIPDEPYHFHIYSHKHNTHVTVTKPNRDAILSYSCGNLGFKKSQRKPYDAAYQLGAYVIDKMHQVGLVKEIQKLEVVLRGFGPGREAVLKVLLGNEGKLLRGKIIRVADSTRLKFGGTRSPNPRRLG